MAVVIGHDSGLGEPSLTLPSTDSQMPSNHACVTSGAEADGEELDKATGEVELHPALEHDALDRVQHAVEGQGVDQPDPLHN